MRPRGIHFLSIIYIRFWTNQSIVGTTEMVLPLLCRPFMCLGLLRWICAPSAFIYYHLTARQRRYARITQGSLVNNRNKIVPKIDLCITPWSTATAAPDPSDFLTPTAEPVRKAERVDVVLSTLSRIRQCWLLDKIGWFWKFGVKLLSHYRGGSRIFPREGRLVQRGGIFRVGGRRGLT